MKKRARSATATPSASEAGTPTPAKRVKAKDHNRILEVDDEKNLESLLKSTEKSTRPEVYASYHPPTLTDPPLYSKHKARLVEYACRTCSHIKRIPINECRSQQLSNHRCKSREPGQEVLTNYSFHADEVHPKNVTQYFALWCAVDARVYSIVEDRYLKYLLSRTARMHLPDRTTVSRAVRDLYLFAVEPVKAMLKKAPGLMHVALDAWQTPNGYDVLGIVVFFRDEDKGKMTRKTLALDYVPMPNGHSAKSMEKLLWDVLDKFDIVDRILTMTSDNAANMRKLMQESSGYGIWRGEEGWAILYYFTSAPTGAGGAGQSDEWELDETEQWAALDLDDDEDGEEIPRDDPPEDEVTADAVSLHTRIREKQAEREAARQAAAAAADEAERAAFERAASEVDGFEPRAESVDDPMTRSGCRNVLKKATHLAKKLRYGPSHRETFAALCVHSGNENTPHSIPRPVKTRWNSMYLTLERIDTHAAEVKDLQKNKKLQFKPADRLSKADFTLIRLLVKALKVRFFLSPQPPPPQSPDCFGRKQPFYDLTMQFSAAGSPFIEEVIPAIDTLTTELERYLSDSTIPAALHNALLRGHEKLLLHPSYGTPYMLANGWPQDWVDTAIAKAQEWYDTTYRDEQERAVWGDRIKRTAAEQQRHNGKIGKTAFERMLEKTSGADIDFDHLLEDWAATERTRRGTNGKPLNAFDFFASERACGREHHGLTEMGLDLFSAVAASIDVERGFSFGGHFMSSKRHRLAPKSVCAGMALRSYANAGLVDSGLLNEGRRLAREARKAEARSAAEALVLESGSEESDSDEE
ncbi:hypothetical protein Rhopal_007347-T1 [Rhodotorula paludigena]|uniref:HAT C-terminal dimerisation domain-containing protein n=1 Tax=Rhodotorula paludigena TaxID=86838 RepID=A0AAV5GVG6_9BASI|nr:hypothetical protein Rhopal_007347-T1 [Rhodotorula paludigena]